MSDLKVGPFKIRVERRGVRTVFGRRRREGLRLTVERDGSLRATVPLRTPISVVEEFVLANTTWIETQQDKMRQAQERNPPKLFVEGERYRFFGEERTLCFEETVGVRARVDAVDNLLVVTMRSEDRSAEKIRAAMAKFFDAQARLHLTERVAHFSKRMGLFPAGLSFRSQKTRWGSCSSQGHISLNWKLVFAPEPVIDYLVIHELAHLKHPNHSDRFWNLVETFDPEWRLHRRWLRDHQHETEFWTQPLSE